MANPIIEAHISFVWGQTNDEYAWPANSFWNSKNVELRRNTREVTLSWNVNNQVFTVWWVPMAIYGTQSINKLVFCSNGKISSLTNPLLRSNTNTASWSYNYRNVVQYWTISGKPWLLVLASKYIHTIAYDTTSLPWTVVEDVYTFANTNEHKPYCIFNWDLLIGDWNYIQKIERTWSTYVVTSSTFSSTTALIGIDITESILWIFELWDQIVFFTDKAQYFWDWYNSAYDRRVPWNETIVSVSQFKTSFNVITNDWVFITLWETSTGYDRVEIQKEEVYWTNPKRLNQTYSYTNSMKTKNGITYFWGWDDGELCSYGYYTPWMPKILMKHITGTGWITCIQDDAFYGLVYYWWYSWTTYYVWYMETSKNVPTPFTTKDWLLEMTPYLWDAWSTNSEMVKYRIGYKLDSSSCLLPIYARLDEETDKFTFYATSYTILPLEWANYTHNSSTYTVVSTKVSNVWWLWLTCQRTAWTTNPATTGTLSKAVWTGDATITFTYFTNYRCIWLVDGSDAIDLASYRKSFMYNELFNKIQFAIGFVGTSTATPRLKDFYRVCNDIQNDL